MRRTLFEASEKISPTKRVKRKEKEYEKDIFILGGDEGAEFEDFRPMSFTAGTVTNNIGKEYQIKFYAKIIGFSDSRAPMRNWGLTIKNFVRVYRRKMRAYGRKSASI